MLCALVYDRFLDVLASYTKVRIFLGATNFLLAMPIAHGEAKCNPICIVWLGWGGGGVAQVRGLVALPWEIPHH